MKDIFRLHVPSDVKYTRIVEEFTLSAMNFIYPHDEQIRAKISAVMNEVFVNIVEHSDTSKIDNMVRIQFELGTKSFLISIYDSGPGIEFEGERPPYSKKLIGKENEFRKVIDGTVLATVVNPHSLSFKFRYEESDEFDFDRIEQLDNLKGHGFGISIITKVMDSVTYSYVGDGKYDWLMIKNLEEKS